MKATQDLARRMREHAGRVSDYRTQDHRMRRGIVLDPPPSLRVELVDSSLILDDDDVTLGYSARKFDLDVGIAAGDTLILAPTHDGDWIAVDVVTEQEVI